MTQGEKIMALLSDGEPHSATEVRELIAPSGRNAVRSQICRLRDTLPREQNIVTILGGDTTFYQLVRRLASANDGRK